MNKADKVCIAIILMLAFVCYLPLLWNTYQNQSKSKEIVVSFKDQEVLRKRLDEDGVYRVKGTLGIVEIEVKDDQVRVEKETSPNHLCSIQGWVSESNRPIVCLPNNIVVEIKATDFEESEVDTVIQ